MNAMLAYPSKPYDEFKKSNEPFLGVVSQCARTILHLFIILKTTLTSLVHPGLHSFPCHHRLGYYPSSPLSPAP